ncbi:Crp/Fnr family transcriptional regulator [Celeribacter halophilus]
MNLLTFLMQSPDLSQGRSAEGFAAKWVAVSVDNKTQIVGQEDVCADEFILLSGCLSSTISDPDGKEVCVGLFVGPCVVTPSIARTRARQSLVSIVATTDAQIARIDSDLLTEMMIASEPVRNWANGVLREALGHKADREWCLTALGGSDRLAWFRETYSNYEDIFNHALIASFLGVTPVTLSRLRQSVRSSG